MDKKLIKFIVGFWVLTVIILGAGFIWIKYNECSGTVCDFEPHDSRIASNFEECLTKGGQVMESYPRQCIFNGINFREDILMIYKDLITVTNIRPGQSINSPLSIEGKARGNWYFEASFPVSIINESGDVLGSGIATAQDEWMTENFVPFKSEINFSVGNNTKGFIILKKDNPSGLVEFDDEFKIPIILN